MKKSIVCIFTLLLLCGCSNIKQTDDVSKEVKEEPTHELSWIVEPTLEFDEVYVLEVHPSNLNDYEIDTCCGVRDSEIVGLNPNIDGYYDYGNVFVRVGDNHGVYDYEGNNKIPVNRNKFIYMFFESETNSFARTTYLTMVRQKDSDICEYSGREQIPFNYQEIDVCRIEEWGALRVINYKNDLSEDKSDIGYPMSRGSVVGAFFNSKNGKLYFDNCSSDDCIYSNEVSFDEVLNKSNGAFITYEHSFDTMCIVNKNKEFKPIDKSYKLYFYKYTDGSISYKFNRDKQIDESISLDRVVNGKVMVLNGNNKFVYLDLDANQISDEYDYGYHFTDGLAAVKKDNKWGYIDEQGNEVIPFVFEEARPLYEGKAYVKVNGKWGILDIKKSLENEVDFEIIGK